MPPLTGLRERDAFRGDIELGHADRFPLPGDAPKAREPELISLRRLRPARRAIPAIDKSAAPRPGSAVRIAAIEHALHGRLRFIRPARKRLPLAIAVEIGQAAPILKKIGRPFAVLNAAPREIERPNLARALPPSCERAAPHP